MKRHVLTLHLENNQSIKRGKNRKWKLSKGKDAFFGNILSWWLKGLRGLLVGCGGWGACHLNCKLTFELYFSPFGSKLYFSSHLQCISPIVSEVIERVAQLVGGLWRLGGVPPVQPGLSLGDTRAPTLSQRSTGISFEMTSISSFFCSMDFPWDFSERQTHRLFFGKFPVLPTAYFYWDHKRTRSSFVYYYSNHNLNNFCKIADSNFL